MDNTKGDNGEKQGDDFDVEKDSRRSKIWGSFYLILGIGGLVFSIFSLWHDIGGIVPLYGTVMASILVGAISLLILIYGYRVIRRDV